MHYAVRYWIREREEESHDVYPSKGTVGTRRGGKKRFACIVV